MRTIVGVDAAVGPSPAVGAQTLVAARLVHTSGPVFAHARILGALVDVFVAIWASKIGRTNAHKATVALDTSGPIFARVIWATFGRDLRLLVAAN